MTIDISNVYNCVKVSKIYQILRDPGFQETLCAWILNFLSQRLLRETKEVNDALPQGSCLSPILFNLYTSILNSLDDNNTKVFQYADDFLIKSYENDFDMVVDNSKHKIRKFAVECSLNLDFNPSKMYIMYLAEGSRKEAKISVNGIEIKQVKCLKYLGRTIKPSLTVKDHYEHAFNETTTRYNAFEMLTSIKQGETLKDN